MQLFSGQRLAGAGMLAGLLLAGSGTVLAQTAPTAARTLPQIARTTSIDNAAAQIGPSEPPSPVAVEKTSPALPSGEAVVIMPEQAEGEVVSTPGGPECRGGKYTSSGVDWTKVPPIEVMPRPGNFLIPPTGPGYYSLLDMIEGKLREKPPIFPYPPFAITANSSFNYDFRYLDKPDNTQTDPLDPLKRIHLGDDWLLSIGGEFRWRHMHEVDSRFTGRQNTYELIRTRLNADLWYKDKIRIYAEMIDARTYDQDLPPLLIDQNHLDIQNLFADLKLFELDGNPAYFRVGRQELLYGSQRLISPLDWANTRRTFQGIKGFWHSEKLDVDAFWVQPVIVNPTKFDSIDDRQGFAGLFTTYRPTKSQSIDLYYLYLDNTNPNFTGETIGRTTPRGIFNVSTIGGRYYGDYNKKFLWETEGGYQFGDFVNQSISAGFFVAGLGYHFTDLPMNPTFWVYNEFYSGDHKPNATGTHGTFNQLFPFGHYYMGFTDLVGQQNIDDVHFHFTMNPAKWVTLGCEYHIYRLDSARDSLYNAGGAPILTDRTGRSGTDVGDELDFTANFHLTQHQDIFIGWSKLYAGQFTRRASGNNRSPELCYLMYAFKF